MEDENFALYAYGYRYPYYGHPYGSGATAHPTWPVTNQSPSLHAGNGGFCVGLASSDVPVAQEESPVGEGSKGSSSEQTEDSLPPSTVAPTYSYLVKIIPPNNKRRATVQEMYDVEMFESPDILKAQIKDSFGDKVGATMDFQIGYFEGRGSAKRWISSGRDLSKMYSLFETGSRITLWCDGIDEKENQPPTKKKRIEGSEKTEKSGRKRDVAEEELKEIVDELKLKNPELALPQIRLWGKMIQAGQYDSYDTPPDIQLIRGCPVPAKPKKESVVDIIAGAATAVVKAFQQGNNSPSIGHSLSDAQCARMSPMKVSHLRRNCLEDLERLKNLLEAGVLTEQEFSEEKGQILHTLKNLR